MHNQDPNFYSKDYFLQSCAGNKDFSFGEESSHELYRYIFENMGINCEGKKILDLGFGRGELCMSSLRKGAKKVTGIDFSKDAVEIANENLQKSTDIDKSKIEFLHGNALELDLPDKYDIIFLTDIIEHLYDDQNEVLFDRVYKHLNENGQIVIHTMPTKDFMYIGQFFKLLVCILKGRKFHLLTFETQAAGTHVNLFHKEQLEKHLERFDYKVWYDFSGTSFLRRIISATPLVRILSGNLWAIACHKN